MKNPHATAPLLLLAALLASGCAAPQPTKFSDLVPEKPEDIRELALTSDRLILVTVDAERRVFFRKEQVGTTDEVGTLKERVRQAIERNRRAARDSGDKEAAEYASTVFVCAP